MNIIQSASIYAITNGVVILLILFFTEDKTKQLVCQYNNNDKNQFNKIINYRLPKIHLSARDTILTTVIGIILGHYCSGSILYGIIIQWALSIPIHLAVGAKTKLLYYLGLSNEPDGTGHIPLCVPTK